MMRTKNVSSRSIVAIGMTFVVVASGCAERIPTGKHVPTVAAEGVLTYQGKPLAFHEVKVFPEDERPAIGLTDEGGHFILGTNQSDDGAVAGTHQVAIVYVGDPADDPANDGPVSGYTPPAPPSIKIDAKYQKAETSGLTLEIPPSGSTDLVIDLK
jgi:hypothetical protein